MVGGDIGIFFYDWIGIGFVGWMNVVLIIVNCDNVFLDFYREGVIFDRIFFFAAICKELLLNVGWGV